MRRDYGAGVMFIDNPLSRVPQSDSVFIRRARAEFIIAGNEPTPAGELQRANGNPDLAELFAYNKQACRHPAVEGALVVIHMGAAAVRAMFGQLDIWEALCPDCKRLVLAVPSSETVRLRQ